MCLNDKIKMGNRGELTSSDKEEGEGSTEGDGDIQGIAETYSQYQIGGNFQATVTVRELRSEGLSFQLWPAANAVCWYIETEFGEGGMWRIDARPPSPQWDVARWDPTSGNGFSNGFERDDEGIRNGFESVGRYTGGQVNGEVLKDMERPVAGRYNDDLICGLLGDLGLNSQVLLKAVERSPAGGEKGNLMDSVLGVKDSNSQVLLKEIGRSLAGGESGNLKGSVFGIMDSNSQVLLEEIERPFAGGEAGNLMESIMGIMDSNSQAFLKEIEKPLAGGDTGNLMDSVLGILDSNPQFLLKEIERPLAGGDTGNLMNSVQSILDSNSQVLLQEIQRPLPSRDTANLMDSVPSIMDFNSQVLLKEKERPFPSRDDHIQTKNCIEKMGIHDSVDDSQAAQLLCKQAGNIHFPMRRMRVLELGSGTGLVGIVAACMGAEVILTDLPHVIPNISFNLDLSRGVIEAAKGSAEAKVLCWGVEEDVKALGDLSFDLILASDCVYHDTAFKPLMQTLEWLMMPAGRDLTEPQANDCVILLGHMRRWKKDSHFFRMASKSFEVDVVHRHPPEDNARIGPIVYRLRRRLNRKSSSRSLVSSFSASLKSASLK